MSESTEKCPDCGNESCPHEAGRKEYARRERAAEQLELPIGQVGPLLSDEELARLEKGEEKPLANGLWIDHPDTPEGKYLVTRRDGTDVEWLHFVLGARDPAAPAALRAYAAEAERLGMDPAFVAGVRRLAERFETYRADHGQGDPDRHRHRKDDPATVARMRRAAGLDE